MRVIIATCQSFFAMCLFLMIACLVVLFCFQSSLGLLLHFYCDLVCFKWSEARVMHISAFISKTVIEVCVYYGS